MWILERADSVVLGETHAQISVVALSHWCWGWARVLWWFVVTGLPETVKSHLISLVPLTQPSGCNRAAPAFTGGSKAALQGLFSNSEPWNSQVKHPRGYKEARFPHPSFMAWSSLLKLRLPSGLPGVSGSQAGASRAPRRHWVFGVNLPLNTQIKSLSLKFSAKSLFYQPSLLQQHSILSSSGIFHK